ncbi:DUF6873 family GME fold protein [Clostridium sp. 'White wine YQ']|uniref:DUF6873 family GME fold protein n=1 Tax=Clostridium sp. 'White wine YQ' TaxID=3027474 RepID=UPI0023665613|nr:hypothetical protein [Clostridium sp. 'White wine YQ']MDD7794004.1 hypothetical protein [Clostridium sp. 'White wine YQ']
MNIAFVDYRTSDEEMTNLSKYVDNIISVPKFSKLYSAIDGHPDIQLSLTNSEDFSLIVNKDIDLAFLDQLNNLDIKFKLSNGFIGSAYPENISLNAIVLKDYLIHNLKYTDFSLLDFSKDKVKINIKQGYAKCSTVILREKALITSDKGIYKTLIKYGFDILLLNPGDILLPGLNYGFIGGATGLLSSNKLGIFGDLSYYNQGNEVLKFLKKYDIEPISLRKGPLVDRGSLFTLS